jgi:hypothetical protein
MPVFSIPTDQEQYERIWKAVNADLSARRNKRYGPTALSPCAQEYSSEEALRLFEGNPYAASIWMDCLLEAIGDHLYDAAALTVINDRWNRDLTSFVSAIDLSDWFDRCRTEAETYIRSRFRGYDFLLKFSLGLTQVNDKRLRFVCLHAHGLIWGRDKKLDRRVHRLEVGLFGLPGGRMDDDDPSDSWIRYITNDPRAKTKRATDSEGKLRSWKRDDYLTQKELVALLDAAGDRQKPSLCIGSGRGKEILKGAVRLASQRGYQLEK